MTLEELRRLNSLHKNIQIYEDAIKSRGNANIINVGSLSENEMETLYSFMQKRYEKLKSDFAALRVTSETDLATLSREERQ